MENKWIALKGGEVVGMYDTKAEAHQHGDRVLSPLVPTSMVPDDARLISMEEYLALWRYSK